MLQVKQNFERFISCKNTIDSIHLRLRKTEVDDGEGANGAGAVVVTRAVEDVRLMPTHVHVSTKKPSDLAEKQLEPHRLLFIQGNHDGGAFRDRYVSEVPIVWSVLLTTNTSHCQVRSVVYSGEGLCAE